jgi:hypothetical protein
MGDDARRRVSLNEATFRTINEAIERRTDRDPITFVCECARLGCNELLELTGVEYQQVRAHPRRFAVLVGHELPDVEDVIARHELHLVVEKRGEAGDIAMQTDPRTPLSELE